MQRFARGSEVGGGMNLMQCPLLFLFRFIYPDDMKFSSFDYMRELKYNAYKKAASKCDDKKTNQP